MILTAGAVGHSGNAHVQRLGVPGVKVSEHRETFRCLSTGANYTTKAATQATDTPYSQSSRVGERKGQARQNPAPERPVKGK